MENIISLQSKTFEVLNHKVYMFKSDRGGIEMPSFGTQYRDEGIADR
jgi:hypothetical protein